MTKTDYTLVQDWLRDIGAPMGAKTASIIVYHSRHVIYRAAFHVDGKPVVCNVEVNAESWLIPQSNLFEFRETVERALARYGYIET